MRTNWIKVLTQVTYFKHRDNVICHVSSLDHIREWILRIKIKILFQKKWQISYFLTKFAIISQCYFSCYISYSLTLIGARLTFVLLPQYSIIFILQFVKIIICHIILHWFYIYKYNNHNNVLSATVRKTSINIEILYYT